MKDWDKIRDLYNDVKPIPYKESKLMRKLRKAVKKHYKEHPPTHIDLLIGKYMREHLLYGIANLNTDEIMDAFIADVKVEQAKREGKNNG